VATVHVVRGRTFRIHPYRDSPSPGATLWTGHVAELLPDGSLLEVELAPTWRPSAEELTDALLRRLEAHVATGR
jgi:hypothetical protein